MIENKTAINIVINNLRVAGINPAALVITIHKQISKSF
jgi:hypothetical protein